MNRVHRAVGTVTMMNMSMPSMPSLDTYVNRKPLFTVAIACNSARAAADDEPSSSRAKAEAEDCTEKGGEGEKGVPSSGWCAGLPDLHPQLDYAP